MFGLFKKKSPIDKLNEQYTKLLEEAHKLSASNRRLSDEKMAQANEVLQEIDKLKQL